MTWATGMSAASLALVHLLAGRLRLLDEVPRSRWLSFGGGVSVSYVFVHILPSLAERQRHLEDVEFGWLGFLEHHVYLLALLGLGVFYGLERLASRSRARRRLRRDDDAISAAVFWIHVASYTPYNALIGYLLWSRGAPGELALFTAAMAAHFVVNDYGLRHDHRRRYREVGRWLLSAGVLLGWLIGALTRIHPAAIAALFAFLAGVILLNVLKEELPDERDSTYWAFALGATGYAMLLLLAQARIRAELANSARNRADSRRSSPACSPAWCLLREDPWPASPVLRRRSAPYTAPTSTVRRGPQSDRRARDSSMATTRVAINGFGRIGRLTFRQFMESSEHDCEVVAINDIAPLDNLAYLLRHDSVQADPAARIQAAEQALVWDGREVRALAVKEPRTLPWAQLGVDIVVECSGRFTDRDGAGGHLKAGARRVVISAPAKQPDLTICMGVNEDTYDPAAHAIVSNASCTTNCLATVVKVLDDAFGVEQGLLTTVHAYTSSQQLVDGPSRKWRRGRAGAVSIVPAATGAAVATTEVLPHLRGKINGLAMRVPVAAGSITDFVARTRDVVTVEGVNQAFRDAAGSPRMRGILGHSDEELVSADIVGSSLSALVDGPSIMVLGERMVKVLAWYDNEWGYARRCVDLVAHMARSQARSGPAAA